MIAYSIGGTEWAGASIVWTVDELAYLIFLGACALAVLPASAAVVPVDLSGYNAASPVDVVVSGSLLTVTWYESGTACKVQLNLDPAPPILNEIRYGTSLLAQNVTIRYYVTEGSRSAGSPGESYIFFDNPSARPYTQNTSTLNLTLARVSSSGNRVAITLSPLSADLHRQPRPQLLRSESPVPTRSCHGPAQRLEGLLLWSHVGEL